MVLFTTTVLVIAIIGVVLAYFKWTYQYWKRRNLAFLEPTFPSGNLRPANRPKECIGVIMKRNHDIMREKGWKHGGIFMFTTPIYMVLDPQYIRNIFAKDFSSFINRGGYYNEKDDPLSLHLVTMEDQEWRNTRVLLTPTFTSGKLKNMFQTMLQCAQTVQELMEESFLQGGPIDIKNILSRFTLDIVGSCGFGLDFNAIKDVSSPFATHGRRLFESSIAEDLRRNVTFAFPKLSRALGIRKMPKDATDFFLQVVKETVQYRETNNYTRKDFMQLLIDIRNNKESDEKTLTITQVAAQALLFYAAGFESSSTTMAFAMYELARNTTIQEKVREEIKAVLAKHDEKITYEALQEMTYLNQVVDETLRLHPPFPVLIRKCVKDYKVPDEDIIIEAGTNVLVSILGIHYDATYWPEPEKFDPERFNETNKKGITNYTYLPFGDGPRNCIGMRFGLLQTKLGLVAMLNQYKFSVNRKTKEPVTMQASALVLAVEGEIWLDAQKI